MVPHCRSSRSPVSASGLEVPTCHASAHQHICLASASSGCPGPASNWLDDSQIKKLNGLAE